ncbi:hypothetical protein F5148DRAFT_1278821 [Russula earlei]|uniref:Uncharacterized protein n=1 Tax=Russula earlei TaxID=71964 RepID=A0ACC0UQU3_9AGAM|nr:hypothetical protein F5148DRAFT_1278821 [Russula earlei]
MSDSLSPPPYVPGKSSFKRFLNWMMPPLGIPIEQMRPDIDYVRLILGAVYDIRICIELFDGWSIQLDKVSSEKPDDRESVLRHHLDLLREDAGWCARATNAILLCHAQFAYLMARRIDGASKSWIKGLKYGSDTTRIANDVNKASRTLSWHVAQMQANLSSFVSALEKMEVRKKRPTAQRILGWLRHLFNALARIFALGTFLSPFVHSAAPGVGMIAPAASTLWKAAAAFCGAASGAFSGYAALERKCSTLDADVHEGKESESIESVLQFLKETVPKEAHTAQKRLARFDEALFVMGLEARMKTGRRVALRGPDPAAVAQEWSDVAKQYQSMLPDDDDEDSDNENPDL